jgi:hypothetical protein
MPGNGKFWDAHHCKWDNIFLSSVVMMIHGVLCVCVCIYICMYVCTRRHAVPQESVVIKLSWNTSDKYCNMVITFSTFNSWVDSVAHEYAAVSRYISFRCSRILIIAAASPWDRSVTLTCHLNAGQPWTVQASANKNVIIPAVEWED